MTLTLPSRRLPGFGLWTLDFGLFPVKSQQRLPDGLRDEAAHFGFAMKFHLALGRVDIHVHRSRIDFQKQTADRIATFHQSSVIPFQQREIESSILDRTAI